MKVSFRSAKTAVIAELLQNEHLSRLELSKRTGASPAAITEVTQNLLRLGLLLETMPRPNSGKGRGRPTVQLSLDASHSFFAGVSLGEGDTLFAITDLRGRVLHCESVAESSSPSRIPAAVRNAYRSSCKVARIRQDRVRGVGIGVAGIVDAGLGICRYSAGLDWRDVPIADMIGKLMGIPAWADNDANAIAVSEKIFGLARDNDNFSSVVLGRTIGSAHYMQGMLYRGHDGGAGEIGHITVDPNGLLCRCGRHGCLDTIAGGFALRRAARSYGLRAPSMGKLEEIAIQGNADAIRLLREAGKALGSAVATLVHLNNPKAVLFADLEGFGNGVFRSATRQAIENGIIPRLLGSTEILFKDTEPAYLPRSAASLAALNYLVSL